MRCNPGTAWVGLDLLTVYTRFWEHLTSSLEKKPSTATSSISSPDIEYDKNDMLPAGKFPEKLRRRLRQANKANRPKIFVHSVVVGKTTLYSYSDAKKRWPDAFARPETLK